MPVDPRATAITGLMVEWRHHLHAHPETAFQEHRTASFVAARLDEMGLDVTTGLAGTGVIGTLSTGPGPVIALRADMDALPMEERSGKPHASTQPGRMHACGHDGHMAMLLGAAKVLAEHRSFRGTTHFIFQPAEENEGGGKRMVAEGLFHRFPAERVFGLHNWPHLPMGQIAVPAGPMMAAYDIFEITLSGKGAHAAMPHQGHDVILAAAQLVGALQAIVARSLNPQQAGVVSVTQIHAGDTWNVLPAEAVLRGTARHFLPEVQDLIERRMAEIVGGIAKASGIEATLDYRRRYPATVNHPAETEIARKVAARLVGEENVISNPLPSMGSEDFSYMLRERPGCYAWLGAGAPGGSPGLHNPAFDFNDEVLALGTSYWVGLVETLAG